MNVISQRRYVNKPWGKHDLGAFEREINDPSHKPIGEIWYTGRQDNDVLVKYLFTSQRLSVQVHPNDAQAVEMGYRRGKEECWLILDAEPGAEYAVGLKRSATTDEVRAAALDGTIVDLIAWQEAHVGDFIYNPAGTIHALGAGLTVLEVQQNSDVTFRLFDYFSDRQLHLDESLRVARLAPHDPRLRSRTDFAQTRVFVNGPKFGFAYVRGELPALPLHAAEFQLVTWSDTVVIGDTLIPRGSCVDLDVTDIGRIAKDATFFLTWSTSVKH